MPSLTMNRPSSDVESPAAAHEAADYHQAEYFLRLLTQTRRLTDHRIGEYHKAMARAEADGDAEGVSAFRRMARIEELDRQTLDGLIENLHRRFALRAPAEVPAIPRRARLVAR
jgi:hypothetical protein